MTKTMKSNEETVKLSAQLLKENGATDKPCGDCLGC